ncbi:hypothetical protein BH11CYA1_BH11CYA1_33740 [soil metagenome]
MKALNLEQKYLVAISVPLIIQVLTIAILVTILLVQRNNYLHEAKIREVSRLSALTPKALLRCGQACVYVDLGNNPQAAKGAFESTNNLKMVAAQLSAAADGDEELTAHTNRISGAVNTLVQEFSQYASEVTRPDRQIGALDKEGMRRRLNGATDIMLAEAAAIAEIESDSNSLEGSQRLYSLETIITLTLAGIALTILNSLGTAYFFDRDIAKRLEAICKNVLRISQQKSLLAPIGGADELTALDYRFHKMARALGQASSEKKNFTELLEDRLRAPLIEFKAVVARLLEQEATNLTDQGRERLAGANHASQRLIALLSELIDIENLQAGSIVLRKTEIKAIELINQSSALLSEMAQAKGCAIETAASSEIIIMADFDRLLRVITNLLSNAIKFSTNGEAIKIGYSTKTNETESNKKDLIFFVHNRGTTIPQNMQTKIFERYEQIDQKSDTKKQSGTGLGLFICKEIVEAHGGKIWVESSAEQGTTFYFRIPK